MTTKNGPVGLGAQRTKTNMYATFSSCGVAAGTILTKQGTNIFMFELISGSKSFAAKKIDLQHSPLTVLPARLHLARDCLQLRACAHHCKHLR